MKSIRRIVSVMLLGWLLQGAATNLAPPISIPSQGTMQVAFTPWDDVEAIIVDAISTAHKQVLVQAYLLTSEKIAKALVIAHQRGLDIQVLADAQQSHVPSAKLSVLVSAGIPVWLETKYQNAHNKIILIDASEAHPTLITGSFNFTWTAQHKNAENILIVHDNPGLIAHYSKNWERHKNDAVVSLSSP